MGTLYKDGLDTCLEVELVDDPHLTTKCHINCVSTYTPRHHISRHLKRKGDIAVNPQVSPKRRRSFGDSTFSFLWLCIFCGLNCNIVRPAKNPGRRRKTFVFRQDDSVEVGKSLKQYLLDKCDER